MSDLPAFFQDMHTLSANAGTAWPVCAQAGSSIAYVGLSPGQHVATNGKTMLEQIQALDACVTRLHGRRVIERAPVEVKRHCDVWGTPADDFALMRAIKKSFDPYNRLNPGRFLGGL
jgi:glycolate oxidase FAD binding subunit